MKNKFMILLMLLTVLTISVAGDLLNNNQTTVAGVEDLPIYIGRSIRV